MGLKFQLVFLVLIVQSLVLSGELFKPFNVSYDGRAIMIDGERRMLISGGIHYPRATPEMWPNLISKSKEGGVDTIETYVFWNVHEPVRGQYNFEGRYDIVKFVKQVGLKGLYLFLRIGPYVCAEWNFGGFPVWLRDIPGIEFRTDNKPFKEEMQRFVKKIVDMMREQSLFSWQGGPIILLQIENEYGNIESSYGSKGKDYMRWAANMAVGLGAGVPWVMCKQADAPASVIDTCNGYYCDGFKPNSNSKPIIWTENWDGWYTSWGDRVPHRPTEDLAFAVARFFQRGGSFQNYYMYFGGTNFGRTAGGPNYITSYDYDAPIDEYGLLRQPKWGHLKDLHASIKLCEPALTAVRSPEYIKLGSMQEAHIYRDNGSSCSAFLANIDEQKSAVVKFLNGTYTLPPWSVSVLPDCRNTAFNTAQIGAQTSIKTVGLGVDSHSDDLIALKSIAPDDYISRTWNFVKEPIGVWSEANFTCHGILEHLNVTKDQSDYLWYTARVYITDDDISFWEWNQLSPKLSINSMRDLVYIFVNGKFTGSAKGKWIKVVQSVDLVQGYNNITLLSQTVGLQNYGAFLEKDGAGFRGQIKLTGCKNGDRDITESLWAYQVGLKGEDLKFYAVDGNLNAEWTEFAPDAVLARFSWYKTRFDAPSGSDAVALGLSSMGKGQAWVNGHHIGRYWTLNAPNHGCQTCNYRGAYDSDKCVTNCGKPTQSCNLDIDLINTAYIDGPLADNLRKIARYHVPRSWLQASDNLLVIFEEMEKSPHNVSIKLSFTDTICAQVSENHYPPLDAWFRQKTSNETITLNSMVPPEMNLACDTGNTFSAVDFASYGTSHGSCQKFSVGSCHSPQSYSVVTEACLGRQSCSISISNFVFGGDPCRGVIKTLSVQMRCSPSASSSVNSLLMK